MLCAPCHVLPCLAPLRPRLASPITYRLQYRTPRGGAVQGVARRGAARRQLSSGGWALGWAVRRGAARGPGLGPRRDA